MENGDYIYSMPEGRVFSRIETCHGGSFGLFEWRGGRDANGRHFSQPKEICCGCGSESMFHVFVDLDNAAENLDRAKSANLYKGTHEELSRLMKEKKQGAVEAAFEDSLEEIERYLRLGHRRLRLA